MNPYTKDIKNGAIFKDSYCGRRCKFPGLKSEYDD